MNNINDRMQRDQHKIQVIMQRIKGQQNKNLRTIDNKCVLLSDSIIYLQKSVSLLENKIKQNNQMNEMNRLSELRDKQKQFIISELQAKIKRIQNNQENMQTLLMEKESIVYELNYKCEELKQENQQLKQQLIKKTKQIKQLIKTNSTLKFMQATSSSKTAMPTTEPQMVATLSLSELGTKKQQIDLENQHYQELQSKLKEMEDCLNQQIEQYRKKNAKLQQEIVGLKAEVKKQAENGKRVFELQLRIKNINNQNKQLQQSYTAQVALNNENQLKHHKKLSQLKTQIQQLKKSNKNLIKQTQKMLRKLSATVLGSNDKSSIFIGASTIEQQFQQLAKQILKCHKKQINSVLYQKDTVIEELRIGLESSKGKIRELNGVVEKMKGFKNQRIQKSPVLNGHSISNKSTSKTDLENKQREKLSEKIEKNQQKYQQKLQQVRNQLQQKQKQISDLRKKYDEYWSQMSKKVLQLQSKLAQRQVQYQYQQQKLSQLMKNNSETEKNIKLECDREIERAKQKIKQIESQKQQQRGKIKQIQQKMYAKQKSIRQVQKREKQLQQKIKRMEKRNQSKLQQYKNINENKDKTIEELIAKNQNLLNQSKIAKQKNKLLEANLAALKQSNTSVQAGNSEQLKQRIQSQYILQKSLLEQQIVKKNQQIQQIKAQIQQKVQQIRKKQQKIAQLNEKLNKYENESRLLKSQNDNLRQTTQKIKESNQKSANFSQLKQQYEKRQKMLKSQGQKIIIELKNSKKELQAQLKKIGDEKLYLKEENSQLKQQISTIEQNKMKNQAQKFRESQKQRKVVIQYQQKVSELSSKVSQLQKSLSKSASVPPPIPPSPPKNQRQNPKLKGTDSVQYVQFGVTTDSIQKTSFGINTVDIFALQTQQNGMNRILDLNDSAPQNKSQNKEQQKFKNSNLFMDLNNDNPIGDDVFEICDENQEVNFGQSSINLQIRELFTSLRIQIEKLLNQEQISFGITKLLPQALQDDYFQLMGYIKQKIAQIKVHNQISFIMAEPGNQPEPPLDQSLNLPQTFISRRHSESPAHESLKKIIQEKQALIHSLMNEKTDQENTINQLTMQKEEIEEENENRFMNQCNVYKKQIKEHKKNIDVLEMNFQCLRNIIRNILQAYSEDQDMEDDFRESMTMYVKIGKLSEKERSRINFYIQKYLQIKGLGGD